MKIIITDEEIECEEELEEGENKFTCNNEEEFREKVCELLNDYYECETNYGNPIRDLIRYIDVFQLCVCIEEYNYKVEFVNDDSNSICQFLTKYNKKG